MDLDIDFSQWSKPVIGDITKVTELSTTIISSGCWPSSIITRGSSTNSTDYQAIQLECILPLSVEQIWNTFKEYYMSKYHGRKLTFLSHWGSAEVKLELNKKSTFFSCSTHMMCILMLFNNADKLAYKG